MHTLCAQHRAVVDALEAGDGEAALTQLRAHLRAVFDDVVAIRAAHPDLFTDSAGARPVRRTMTRLA